MPFPTMWLASRTAEGFLLWEKTLKNKINLKGKIIMATKNLSMIIILLLRENNLSSANLFKSPSSNLQFIFNNLQFIFNNLQFKFNNLQFKFNNLQSEQSQSHLLQTSQSLFNRPQ
jgi:hypothetical protein